MTLEWLDVSDTTPRIAYTATASQTDFVIPFEFLDETHLEVYVNDVLKTLVTDYSTTGAEEENGGTLTLVTASTVGDSVVITRVLTYELTIHIPTSGPLDVPAINLQFTAFVMMLQQAVADQARSIRQPASDVVDFDELPVAASRAGKYLGFDGNGQVAVFTAVSTSVAASAFMLTLLDDTSAAAARATLGLDTQTAYVGLSNWHFCR